jgi:hypothetical protein
VWVALLVAVSQVQALRAVEPYLNLDKLYVMGTNCVDNGPREGLEKFLNAASSTPGQQSQCSWLCSCRAPAVSMSAAPHQPNGRTRQATWICKIGSSIRHSAVADGLGMDQLPPCVLACVVKQAYASVAEAMPWVATS